MPRSRAAHNLLIGILLTVTAVLLWDAGVTAYALVISKKAAQSIPQSITLIRAGNISGARAVNARTKQNLAQAVRVSSLYVPQQISRIIKVPHLIAAATAVAQGLDSGIDLYAHGSQLQHTLGSTAKWSEAQSIIAASVIDLQKIKTSLQTADEELVAASFLAKIQKVHEVKTVVHEAYQGVSDSLALYDLGTRLAGFQVDGTGSERYLILFQNNDELRPTGGFIGMYGTLELTQGSVSNFSMSDSYALDDRVRPSSRPRAPLPLSQYLAQPHWYFRDSNWSPDFPTSARQALEFYKQEGGVGSFSGVIALTPEPVAEILAVLGPITVDGVAFDKDNLTDALEFQVERGFIGKNVPLNERKDIAVKLGVALVDRMKNASGSDIVHIARVVRNALDRGDIQLYSSTSYDMNAYLNHVGWSGQLMDAPQDRLMVVDANLASLKTDAAVDRSIDYKVTRDGDDGIGVVTIHYKHTGNFSWKTTRYNSFTRVFVPNGATLISSKGVMERERSDKEGVVVTGQESLVYKKANFQYFGAYISVEPGTEHELQFTYRIPNLFVPGDMQPSLQYSLFVQRQAGTSDYPLHVSVDLGTNKQTWNRLLDRSQVFTLN